MRSILLLASVLLTSTGALAQHAEIRLAPDGELYAWPTNARQGYFDIVVHTVAVANTGSAPLTFDSLRISLNDGANAITRTVPAAHVTAQSADYAGMMEAGMGILVSAQMLNTQGLDGLFERALRISPDAGLEPDEATLTNGYHFSAGFLPDNATVTAVLRREDGTVFSVSETVAIALHESPIEYHAPIDGVWLMHAIPGIQSHHRLNLVTEFAFDFFRVDSNGEAHDGSDPHDATTWYGYGEPVRAAADGEVVFVIDDQVQDRAAMMRQEGETSQEAGRRIQRHNFMRMRENFRAAAGGNLVTIRHENNGRVEYSSYGHLAAGSVTVSVGDRVRQGDVIAAVGDTGDSAAVHLHFQVNDGPDAFMSRSLPVVFADLVPVEASLDPGRFVRAPRRE